MFQIQFIDNTEGVYIAGQTLSGKLHLHLLKEKVIQGLSIHITGKASVQWSESDGSDSKWYWDSQTLLDAKTYLLGGAGGSTLTLAPGKYDYDFQCQLPAQLPSSFESFNGNVRYMVTAALERSWKLNQTSKVAVTVLQNANLNRADDRQVLMVPTKLEFDKYFCCGPCRRGPLRVTAQLPQTGYAPGQTIQVTTDIDNHTKKVISAVQVTLHSVITCYSNCGRSINQTKELVKLVNSNVGNERNAKFVVDLVVPAVAPSFDKSVCKVINLSYVVMVEVKVLGMSINPRLRLPIVVGTVPIAGQRELPPPSYEECILEPNSFSGSNENVDFKPPKYPVYKF